MKKSCHPSVAPLKNSMILDLKVPPKKFIWVPFLRSLPGNEAYKPFSGAPKMGVSGWGAKSLC